MTKKQPGGMPEPANAFLARRAKGIDRSEAAAWLKELRERQGAPEPDAAARVPDDYVRR